MAMSLARTSGATNRGFLPDSFYRLSLVPLVQPHPYIWKEGIDAPACSPIHVHFLPYTVCKERTCSSLPILATPGFCRLFFSGNFLYWEFVLLPATITASISLSPAWQTNDSIEGTCPTAPAHRLPGQSCTVVREPKPALCGVESKARGRKKRMRIYVGSVMAILGPYTTAWVREDRMRGHD